MTGPVFGATGGSTDSPVHTGGGLAGTPDLLRPGHLVGTRRCRDACAVLLQPADPIHSSARQQLAFRARIPRSGRADRLGLRPRERTRAQRSLRRRQPIQPLRGLERRRRLPPEAPETAAIQDSVFQCDPRCTHVPDRRARPAAKVLPPRPGVQPGEVLHQLTRGRAVERRGIEPGQRLAQPLDHLPQHRAHPHVSPRQRQRRPASEAHDRQSPDNDSDSGEELARSSLSSYRTRVCQVMQQSQLVPRPCGSRGSPDRTVAAARH